MPSPARKRREFKSLILAVLILLIVLSGAIGSWRYLINKDAGPIPKDIRQSVGFPLYYPSALPSGYWLDEKSVKNASGIIFFKLVSAASTINVSEQAVPANPPDPDALQRSNTSFKKLDVLGGQAIYGISQGVPLAFLVTNTTMVNINGEKKTPIDVIAKLTQSLSSL